MALTAAVAALSAAAAVVTTFPATLALTAAVAALSAAAAVVTALPAALPLAPAAAVAAFAATAVVITALPAALPLASATAVAALAAASGVALTTLPAAGARCSLGGAAAGTPLGCTLFPTRSVLDRALVVRLMLGYHEALGIDAALGEARQQAANHEGGVGSTGKLEAHVTGVPVLTGHLLLGDLQMTGADEEASILPLELESADSADLELGRDQTLVGQSLCEQATLLDVLHVFEAFPGQAEATGKRDVHVQAAVREDLGALKGVSDPCTVVATQLGEIRRHSPVPNVRLESVEVNQAQARRHVEKGPSEVGRVLAQEVKHGVVLAEATGDVTALGPVAPVVAQSFFEGSVATVVVLRLCTEQIAQGGFVVAEHQLLGHPALRMLQVTEALFVEVVRHAKSRNHLLVGDQAAALHGSQVPQAHFESVAVAVGGAQGFLGTADGFDFEFGGVEAHLLAARKTHELDGDALTVLESSHGNVTDFHIGQVGQSGCRLHGGQLALRHFVDVVLAGLGEVVVFEEFRYAEVTGLLF